MFIALASYLGSDFSIALKICLKLRLNILGFAWNGNEWNILTPEWSENSMKHVQKERMPHCEV